MGRRTGAALSFFTALAPGNMALGVARRGLCFSRRGLTSTEHPGLGDSVGGRTLAGFSAFDELWAGIIENIELDIVGQTLKMVIKVVESSQANTRVLECRGLSEFRYHNSMQGPWKYAELTELHASWTEPSGIRLDFVLWSEDAAIMAVTDSILLDEKTISPY